MISGELQLKVSLFYSKRPYISSNNYILKMSDYKKATY